MKQAGNNHKRILITGANGYVGSRLIKALAPLRYPIRCLTRRPDIMLSSNATNIESVHADLLNRKSLYYALMDVDVAFYLVHSLASKDNFAELDRRAAQNFAQVARESGLRRIIYLGGLGAGKDLSPHLASRHEVGTILRSSGVSTIEFQASIIIGSGSLSFEMIRALVQRLPIMITPRWVRNLAQPIAINDVIAYLAEAIEIPINHSQVFQIGGDDQVSYQGIMQEYARQCHLHRLMIPVPLLTPYLSSLWLSLVTPLYARVGRALIESIKNPTVVNDTTALDYFSVRPCGITAAIEQAISQQEIILQPNKYAIA